MAYPYGSSNTATPVKSQTIDNAVQEFDPVISRLEEYASRLRSIQDRIIGPRPQEVVGTDKVNAPPSAIIESIHCRRHRLVDVVNAIEMTVTHIEGSL